ncbi:WW [Fusarium circinatum]|uniref:WW n=1 Tax=Fusarium circinatum TaxID=48490 RepID=A0A8H5TWB8_FUSCI|nr:WW [Fusarium circinatum]
MNPSPYEFLRSSDGQIRLLILHPASKHDAPIQCFLEPAILSSNPAYEALSYTWGDPGNGCNISLSNHDFLVGDNAAAALRRLRRKREKRVLWIDAICINQADVDEKNTQVPLMQKIYGQAKNVLVWLGEPIEGSILGLRLIQNRMASVGWHQWKIDKDYGKPTLPLLKSVKSSIAWMNRSRLIEEQINGEVRELLDRPWWRRTWIIQEVVLAKNIHIICGDDVITWDAVASLFKRLNRTQAEVHVFGVKLSDRNVFPDQMYRLICGYHQQWHSNGGRLDLLDVLYQFRTLECTVAHDRIYGFLGIVHPDVAAKISPDYNLGVPQVYRDFARTMILVTGNLHVLNCTRHWSGVDNGAQNQEVYSVVEQSRYYDIQALIHDGPDKTPRRGWARLPDGWERIPSKEKSLFRDNRDRTKQASEWSPLEGQQPVRAEHYIKQRELSPGWSKIWDNLGRAKVVYGVGETTREHRLRNEKELLWQKLSRLPSWVANWECPRRWDPKPLVNFSQSQPRYFASGNTTAALNDHSDPRVLSLKGQIIDEIRQLGPVWHPEPERPPISRKGISALAEWEDLALIELPDCPYGGAEGRTNALWRTMIADYTGAEAADSDDWAYIETWYDRTGWGRELPEMASRGISETVTLEMEIRDLGVMINAQFLQIRPVPILETGEVLKYPSGDFSKRKKKYGGYIKRIYDACAHRSLFITYRGYMGLAPWNAQIGDKVAILHGGETPFILRNIKGDGGVLLSRGSFCIWVDVWRRNVGCFWRRT